MSVLNRINQWIAKTETFVLVLIVLLMVFLAALQIFLRKFFNYGILWGDIFLRHLVLWVSFIGASLATKENRHINMDVLGRLLKGKWKDAGQLVIHLFSFFITILLTNASLNFIQSEIEFGSIAFNNVPSWYFEIIIPIGFALMALRFLFNALISFRTLLGYKET